MPRILLRSSLPIAGIVVAVLLWGCAKDGKFAWNPQSSARPAPKPTSPPPPKVLPEARGTIAEFAMLTGGGPQPVEGYCLVVGLGNNGGRECPPAIEKYIAEWIRKNKLGWKVYGTEELRPTMIIRDPDTAVVRVTGEIPPGTPKGAPFDLNVAALPQTQTRDLSGGSLMPTELRAALGGGMMNIGAGSKVLAMGDGEVFVNPFLEPGKASDQAKFRAGRVIGGGRSLDDRPIRLQLYQPDAGRCRRIVERINDRFAYTGVEAAKGINSQLIDLKAPPQFRDDIDHFAELVRHLPMAGSGQALDAHAMEVARMMETTALQEDLAMVWEATGQQAEAVVRQSYTSKNPAVAFYAARAGLRMGDDMAADVVIKTACTPNAKLQLPAIEELGRHRRIIAASAVLRQLLDDENEVVRLAAYDALLRRGDSCITTVSVGGFKMDIVPSTRAYAIYATQSKECRLALFGRNMPVNNPMFLAMPDDLLTMSSVQEELEKGKGKQPCIMLYRKIQRTGKYSPNFHVEHAVAPLVRMLGSPAEPDEHGKVAGLGFTYGQVVTVLQRMCKEGSIQARFVLQQAPDMQRIIEGATGTGRPDVAGS